MTQTVKVMPWGDGQGDYVIINAEDFDPSKHKLLDDFLKEQEKEQAEKAEIERLNKEAERLAQEYREKAQQQAEAEKAAAIAKAEALAKEQAEAEAKAQAQAEQQQNTDDSGKESSATGKAPTKPEIIKMLQDAEIEHNPSATKAELMALLPKV